MQRVIKRNKEYQSLLINEFIRVANQRQMSQVKAIADIKLKGGLISRQNLLKVKNGVFDNVSFTYANIISEWCGYSGFVDLICQVERRNNGIS